MIKSKSEEASPHLSWDQGTAYDLFISLHVLHEPEKFGLRPSWAAGVRSRISTTERKTLEEAQILFRPPLHWIYTLPPPKDSDSAIWALRQLPSGQRLCTLALNPGRPSEGENLLQEVAARQRWDEGDLERLKEAHRLDQHETPRAKDLTMILNNWEHPAEFGERYLEALQSYYQAFFIEEEQYLRPALKEGLDQAQELARQIPIPELIERLSQGLQLPDLLEKEELVFVPSYWITPLVFLWAISDSCSMMTFGARPANASLVPGEIVPDVLLQALKAMADPTRLRILRYLVQQPLTPTEISRRLRLRAPTVTHHLNALRLAGLVYLRVTKEGERQYAARLEAISGLYNQLNEFLVSSLDGGGGKIQ